MQILRSTPATLELKVYQAGDLTDLDATPTITVTDANGASVTAGTVTKPGGTTGTYRSTIDGQADLKDLKAVWVGVLTGNAVSFTQRHQIVANFMFNEADARARESSGQQTPLSDEANYSDDTIAAARQLVAEQFEDRTHRSWVRRYCRMELRGHGHHRINLAAGAPRDVDLNESGGRGRLRDIGQLISATVNGTDVLSNVEQNGRWLILTTGAWTTPTNLYDPFNIVVEYEYGTEPTPAEAKDRALAETVSNLVKGDISQFAQSYNGEDGSILFPTGGLVWTPTTRDWMNRHSPLVVA